jgi:diaminohydroxyphosphoribosylaminopyrimidine deaminase/5-amino-6-(5-phosphoribosylamino)uracil reductase
MPDIELDKFYMKKALRLAARGAGRTSPNPMVGAVLVKDGAIIGQGWHEKLGGPHAEVNAIADAGCSARGATLYVTLEPCNHHGLTPPCTKAVLDAGISRVVCGMCDPNPDVAGGGAQCLTRQGVEVRTGAFESECRGLNQPFIKYVTTGLPYVSLKAAATLDGFIASSTGDSKWITNERSRRFAHILRSMADGVLVGIGTALVDDPLLTVRLPGKKTYRQPVRIILDTHLKLSPESGLVQSCSLGPVWIVCGEGAPEQKEKILSGAGAAVLRVPVGRSGIEISLLLRELGKRRISSIVVEGGGRVLGSFLESGFADECHFFYAPKILGDPDGMNMLSGRARMKISDAVPVYGLRTKRFGEDLLVSGRFYEQLY